MGETEKQKAIRVLSPSTAGGAGVVLAGQCPQAGCSRSPPHFWHHGVLSPAGNQSPFPVATEMGTGSSIFLFEHLCKHQVMAMGSPGLRQPHGGDGQRWSRAAASPWGGLGALRCPGPIPLATRAYPGAAGRGLGPSWTWPWVKWSRRGRCRSVQRAGSGTDDGPPPKSCSSSPGSLLPRSGITTGEERASCSCQPARALCW